ncbi:hypothetical protein [Arthrobacter sp. R4-81]
MSAGTTRHTIRIEDPLWKEAHVKAARDGTTVSELIRAGLRNYVSRTESANHVQSRHTLADSLVYVVPDALYDLQGPSSGVVSFRFIWTGVRTAATSWKMTVAAARSTS